MTDEIAFAVPGRTTSTFVVVADRPPPESGRRWDDPGLRVVTWRADESPLNLRDVILSGSEAQRLPLPSAYHILLILNAPIHRQPRASQIARAHGRKLAAETRGSLIDWQTHEIVLAARRPERARFHLGDQWLGFDMRVSEEAHARLRRRHPKLDLADVDEPCGALGIATRGLARFGLPELAIEGVDCDRSLTAVKVLRTLAQHLLTDHLTWVRGREIPTIRRIAARHRVPGCAFARFWAASFDTEPFSVILAANGCQIRVVAPSDDQPNGWLARLPAKLNHMVGCPPDDAATSDELRLPTS